MRKLSAARTATLRDPHDNTPEHANPPPGTRQSSGSAMTTDELRASQRGALRLAGSTGWAAWSARVWCGDANKLAYEAAASMTPSERDAVGEAAITQQAGEVPVA